MSEVQALFKHYQAVRDRLRNPPNAVPDTGINLRRGKSPPIPPKTEPLKLALPVIDYSQVVPFRRTDLTLSTALEFSAKEYSITYQDIRTRSRARAVALPRQVAIWITTRNTTQSLVSMGRHLGMDHTTILYARNKIQRLFDTSIMFRQYILEVEERFLATFNRLVLPAVSEPHLGSTEA